MSLLVRLLLDPRILCGLLVAGTLGLGWWHYNGLKSDLAEAQRELVGTKAAMQATVAIAENNAEQLAKAETQHRAASAALEEAYEELAAATDAARSAEADVHAAPEDDDGPVAPLLDALRKNRFGGT